MLIIILRVMSQFIFTDQFPGVSTGATNPSASICNNLAQPHRIETSVFQEEELLVILNKTIMKPEAFVFVDFANDHF